MRLLPAFTSDTEFRPDDAFEDKIDLSLGRWQFAADYEDFLAFKDALAVPRMDTRDSARLAHGTHGRWFNRPSGGTNRNRLHFRDSIMQLSGHTYLPPLWGGYLNFSGRSDERFAELRLSLNAARFMRHQPEGEFPSTADFQGAARMERRPDERSRYGGEFAFDGEDNWIPSSYLWRRFTTGPVETRHLNAYLVGIRRIMESEARRARQAVRIIRFSTLNWQRERERVHLRKVETAWECSSIDPRAEALHLGHALMHLRTGESGARFYRIGDVDRAVDSTRIAFPLASGVDFRLYAKTNKRIRFEVIHNDLNNDNLRRAAIGGTAQDWTNFTPMLREVRERAAEHLNRLIADFRRETPVFQPPPITALHLIAEVFGSLPPDLEPEARVSLARTISGLLVHQRGYRGKTDGGAEGRTVRELRRRGVLVYERRAGALFYRLHPDYIPAANALRALPDDPSLAFFGSGPYPPYYKTPDGQWIRNRD